MSRIVHLVPLSLLVFASACTVGVEGSGIPAEQERKIADFHSLEVSDTLHVQVVAGQTQSVFVHGDSNLVNHIRTDVSGGYLFVDADVSYSTSLDLGVLITTPAVLSITARDVSTVEVDGIWNDTLSIVADDVASVRVAGWVNDLELWADGAADVDAYALGTGSTWLELDGTASAQVNVTDRLSGTIAGASTAYVYGRPLLIDAAVFDAGEIVIE